MPINPPRPPTKYETYRRARSEFDWFIYDNFTLVMYATVGLVIMSLLAMSGYPHSDVLLAGYVIAGLAIYLAKLRRG